MKFSGLAILVSLLLSLPGGESMSPAPAGRLLLVSVFINEFHHSTAVAGMNMTLTCSTPSQAGRLDFAYVPTFSEVLEFNHGYDMRMELLPHESVECALTEFLGNEEIDNSHGLCDLTYARFLAPENNTVTCHMTDGSSYALRMDCGSDCPTPISTPNVQYCKRSNEIPPIDIDSPHTVHDGSPGFALYAPNTLCEWKMRRAKQGAVNFLFSRMDLGTGDFITAYASPDGVKRRVIKEYNEYSAPESVSTSAAYLILELKTDAVDEGMGFAGFAYYTNEVIPPVAIVVSKSDETSTQDPAPAPPASVGRKLI